MRTLGMAVSGLVLVGLVGCGPADADRIPGITATAGTPARSTTSAGGASAKPVMPEQTSPRPSRAPGPGDPGFDPIEAAPREQGGSVWAVALAVSDEGPNDPKLAVHPAENFSPAILDVDCDRGSRTGLHLRPEKEYWYAVIYFYSQEKAFKFKELYDLKVVGVVKVEPIKDCR